MNESLPPIAYASLLVAFAPSLLLLAVMKRWQISLWNPIYANGRMLVQLLLVGYLLTYVFETNRPLVVMGVFVLTFLLRCARLGQVFGPTAVVNVVVSYRFSADSDSSIEPSCPLLPTN